MCFKLLSNIKTELIVSLLKAPLAFSGLLRILQKLFHILADNVIPDKLFALEINIECGLADPCIKCNVVD